LSDLVAHPSNFVTASSRARRVAATARSYLMLTKPRVIELLLVTTVPAMILADEGLPHLGLVAAVLVGGAMAAGGANTINCWIERDRDQLMHRTRRRPLPSGDIEPTPALAFGIALEVGAFALLWATANVLAAGLALAAAVFYVFVYTIWLKPRTEQNIVIGGAAGAVPALVGWAAVTGDVTAAAWVLFAIVFFWTPAHFWALAMRYHDDYAAAGFPMLPVTKGTRAATRQILAYAIAVGVISLLLPFVSPVGIVYVVTAAGLGVAFVIRAEVLRRNPSTEAGLRLFMFSNVSLALLFASVAIDTFVRHA
jgi:protoheme IX farnesyltransferase